MKDKELANAFREAKLHLRSDNYTAGARFICHALERAYVSAHITLCAQKRAEALIHGRLISADGIFSFSTLEDWLHAVHNASVHDHHLSDEDFAKLQATRHAWLDSLIEEFS